MPTATDDLERPPGTGHRDDRRDLVAEGVFDEVECPGDASPRRQQPDGHRPPFAGETGSGVDRPLLFRALLFSSCVVLGLVLLHGLEIWGYAFFYMAVGALGDLRTAVYLSTIAYSTVGFDDKGRNWEMVVAIEGINGVILLGWSTAFFVMVVTRLGRRH